MIEETLSKQILTVGCEYRPPRGGIAQVMDTYRSHVYPCFNCVTNSCEGNRMRKIFKALTGYVTMAARLIFSPRIRIVHIHTSSNNSFRRSALFVNLAKALRRKVILHIHSGRFREFYASNPEKISRTLRKADTIITLSPSWKRFFDKITEATKVVVVENVIPYTKTSAETTTTDKLHLLFLGLITNQKGIFDLLEVLSRHPYRNRITLHIGGNGETERLVQLIDQKQLADCVQFEGWVSGERKEALLAQCQALILPSYAEGLPISILEAMAHSRAIFATPVGAIAELVTDGQNGLLFTPCALDEIARTLTYAVDHPEEIRRMGERSLQNIQPYFPDRVAEKLEQIYNKLITNRVSLSARAASLNSSSTASRNHET